MRYANYALKALHPRRFLQLSTKTVHDGLNHKYPVKDNSFHVQAAMNWLLHAQKQNGDGGVAAQYSLFNGWDQSYIETTGYIIPTFFNYAKLSKNEAYRNAAIEMADFELGVQLSTGAFPGAGTRNKPIIFNTGQVLFGLCAAYNETKQKKYKDAVTKTVNFLTNIMDKDGCFRKHTYLGHVHTYNVRVAWSMLEAAKITKNANHKQAAIKNVEWALSQQNSKGWFEHNGFYPQQEPTLHTIAYTLRGILESSMILNNKSYQHAVELSAKELIRLQRRNGSLQGSFDLHGKSSVDWSCLTGNAQMAIIWLKLYALTKDKSYLIAAKRANKFNKSTQNCSTSNKNIKGALPGAYPIFGWYAPYSFINWGTKFFADALILEDNPHLVKNII